MLGKARGSFDFCVPAADRDTVDVVRAMVLAAGLGTRLRPLTLERPKPAVPVAGRPLAWFTLSHLSRFGVRHAVINTHHLAAKLPEFLDPHLPSGMDVTYVHEPTLLGTGGGLYNAAAHLLQDGGPVVVMNGDILFAPDLGRALEAHVRHRAKATMVLREDPQAVRYGAVEIDGTGRVRRLLGAPASVEVPLRTLMFTGVHILSREAFQDLPPEGCVIRHAYRRWIDEGSTVAGVVEDAPFRDLGTLSSYLETNLDLARGALTWPGIERSPSGALIDASARVASESSVEESVLDADVVVERGSKIVRAVAWPGARLTGYVRNAVITSRQTVPVGE